MSTESVGRQFTYRPEVVDEDVEHAQQHHQQDGTQFRLEPNHNHDTSHEPKHANNNPPNAPISRKDEPDEQENQQYPSAKLYIHLAVLFIDTRQAGECNSLPDPAVTQHHEQSAHDREIAQEEVQVEDQAVAECLDNDDGNETRDRDLRVLADYDEGAADGHKDHVEEEEDVRYAARDCRKKMSAICSLGFVLSC